MLVCNLLPGHYDIMSLFAQDLQQPSAYQHVRARQPRASLPLRELVAFVGTRCWPICKDKGKRVQALSRCPSPQCHDMDSVK